jgi:hypothetical protein
VLRRFHRASCPPRTGALLRLFPRLALVREQRSQLHLLVRRARRLVPDVAHDVARLAQTNPDAALAAFVAAFERTYVELDESICDEGFEFWVESDGEVLPLLLRGTDRCNGIEPLGYRPGYALMWTLIQDVFFDDERSQVIAEVADSFDARLADRLLAAEPPPHEILCRRLGRSPYMGLVAFSRYVLGDVSNPVLALHSHHREELRLRWTRRDVARAVRLVQQADDFEAPALALAGWLEHAPVRHGLLLSDAALGRVASAGWDAGAVQPCSDCGFPPLVRTHVEAVKFLHHLSVAKHAPHARALMKTEVTLDRETTQTHGACRAV